MRETFYEIIPTQTDDQVREYVANAKKYTKECVECAAAELAKRGHPLNEDEISKAREEVADRDHAVDNASKNNSFGSGFWNKNIVTDESAPLLYSRRAIYTFTFFGGAVFGAVMLSMNMNTVGKVREVLYAMSFGILYMFGVIYLTSTGINLPSVGVANLLVGWIFDAFFWTRFVGKDTKYRRRPILVPTIIVVALNVLVFLPKFLGM